ncbi:hypothetical protein Tco_0953346 [Tanacetum coccineum]|uniref:Uncharacterized protein n=1 Tax=Tanacetum coccineum TaxID=301880 RepID=A0ABQ5DZK8_9ASTR
MNRRSINSSVEDLILIPGESEDTFDNDSECDLPFCDDSSPLNVLGGNSVTFSNPLFDSNEDFTSSDDESLPEEDKYIESEDSYVSKLDEPDLLVTPLSKLNEDECFDPGDVSMDFEDDYYDSERDIIYLESLLIKDTIPNLPPDVFLDRDPRSLEDEPDKDDLKNITGSCCLERLLPHLILLFMRRVHSGSYDAAVASNRFCVARCVAAVLHCDACCCLLCFLLHLSPLTSRRSIKKLGITDPKPSLGEDCWNLLKTTKCPFSSAVRDFRPSANIIKVDPAQQVK